MEHKLIIFCPQISPEKMNELPHSSFLASVMCNYSINIFLSTGLNAACEQRLIFHRNEQESNYLDNKMNVINIINPKRDPTFYITHQRGLEGLLFYHNPNSRNTHTKDHFVQMKRFPFSAHQTKNL